MPCWPRDEDRPFDHELSTHLSAQNLASSHRLQKKLLHQALWQLSQLWKTKNRRHEGNRHLSRVKFEQRSWLRQIYLNQQTNAPYDQMLERKCVKGCSRISEGKKWSLAAWYGSGMVQSVFYVAGPVCWWSQKLQTTTITITKASAGAP